MWRADGSSLEGFVSSAGGKCYVQASLGVGVDELSVSETGTL